MDVEHASLGTVTSSGPPLRSVHADGCETTRREHLVPPVPDGDGDAVRARLDAG